MKTSLFASTAPIGKGHGGGVVSYHELVALKETTEVVQVLCPKSEDLGMPTTIIQNSHYPDNPFMLDYLYAFNAKHADVAFFNGAPFSITAKAINPSKVIVDCPAHNLEVSIEEHVKWLGNYPYKNMTDPLLKELYLDFIKNADLIICPSKMSADYLKGNPGTRAKVVVIPHGCEIPTEVKPLPQEFKVGYLGAVGPDKGVVYLLKAWAGLMYKDSELVIAGKEGQGLVPWINQLFVKGQKYSLLGFVENPSDFYNSISAYVQPSATEGFGLPVLEAMAHGRPVICSDGAGASELIDSGKDGYVVKARDAASIAERIDYLKTHHEKVAKMGEMARLKAKQYTWDKIEKQYVEAINEAVRT